MQTREIHDESNVSSIAQDMKRCKDLMLIVGLNEPIDYLAMENNMR